MRAIKAVLRTGLPAYAAARYPGLTPLPPDTVRAALGRPRRPVSSARDRSGRTRLPPALRPLSGMAPAHGPEPTPSQSGSSHRPRPESSRRPSSIASSSRSSDDRPRTQSRGPPLGLRMTGSTLTIARHPPMHQRPRLCPATAARCAAVSERPRRACAPHEIPVVHGGAMARVTAEANEEHSGGGMEGGALVGRWRERAPARWLVARAWRLRLPRGVP